MTVISKLRWTDMMWLLAKIYFGILLVSGMENVTWRSTSEAYVNAAIKTCNHHI